MESTAKPGKPCQFYHEGGGHGDKHWVRGWRYGIVRTIPIKGRHKGWARVEIPVTQWAYDLDKRRYVTRANEVVWVNLYNINAVGDTHYHGPTEAEMLTARQEKKDAQAGAIAKAKAAGRRFHR